jgi:hypothetical protein
MPILHENTPDDEVIRMVWTLKGFVKSKKINISKEESFCFKSSNAFWFLSTHSKHNSFFKIFEKGFAICKNPLMKF